VQRQHPASLPHELRCCVRHNRTADSGAAEADTDSCTAEADADSCPAEADADPCTAEARAEADSCTTEIDLF
jgi:hypothetical protein